jgi:hypothetical protein
MALFFKEIGCAQRQKEAIEAGIHSIDVNENALG